MRVGEVGDELSCGVGVRVLGSPNVSPVCVVGYKALCQSRKARYNALCESWGRELMRCVNYRCQDSCLVATAASV